MRSNALLATALGTLMLAGCVNLAPAYQAGDLPVPADLPGATPDAAPAAPLLWNDVVTSPALKQVIGIALEQNRDLRATAANVRAARANLLVSRSALWPAVGASASAQTGDTFDEGTTGANRFDDSTYGQIGVSAWELDFFGRIRNLNDAALQAYLASEEGERAAKISLAGTVAETWMQLAADHELLKLANRTAESQTESLDLTRELFAAGTASELDVRRASASVARAQAQAAQYEAAVRRDVNALQLLVGAPLPTAILGEVSLLPAPVALNLPVGQSSLVLLERPDVRAAEARLRASNANIGAARAAYFPSISLTGGVGAASGSLDDLFNGDGSTGWTFTPAIDLPIFDFDRRRGNLDAARADADAALATYQSTIQQAFREVADAAAIADTIDRRLNALQQLAEDTQVTFELSGERFKSGLDGYLTVLDAQREYYSAQQQLIQANLENSLNSIALYKALGTWSEE
ncbi:NodT family RND efflux system outer membrane lipoprotein [Hyphomonas adhaerens MHS-3]|uniref:NodT family RND efflux system outer membrane lipoprotein n=1 Tax=Hyphomonas adhaerens MHS-3 TaxID=1280949 RepID=A0A069E905_9PROT|nr:TolC family protein [Hyphomonas adhaerens]KCZ85041.1 NodT family RND efflux system outer membrane lipoprotein [Hyphomonas adhaerens MHS-3]